jgi:hypothetical protein
MKNVVGFEPMTAAKRAGALPLSYMVPFCSCKFVFYEILNSDCSTFGTTMTSVWLLHVIRFAL